jgi:rhamnulokinase
MPALPGHCSTFVIDDPLYIAVDLGAGSGRVFLVDLASDAFSVEEVRRFNYPARQLDHHLRWDFSKIFGEIKAGLMEAGRRAGDRGRLVLSLGVDSWGVDYGLIDGLGELVEDPVCYRDPRTQGVMKEVFARVPRPEIFERTGVQFLPFNTLFQLYAHTRAGTAGSEDAAKLLLIPDLVNFFLTGRAVTEYTNATTTQMLNARTRTWECEMIDRLGIPSRLLGELVPAGADLGPLKLDLADELRLHNVRVVAPATHDTGSAVAGTPLEDGWAYISSGTWSLVGVELETPLINSEVADSNFTNEGGAFGTIRFLKNVMGLWILESCRREWGERGLTVDYSSLLNEVSSIDECGTIIVPDDERLFNPPIMLDAISEQLVETGVPVRLISQNPAVITKTILDSLALRYASVLRSIEALTGRKIEGVHIVGGGSRNDYLNSATATATGLPVRAGPIEATVIGNVLVQAIAAGRFASISDGRRYVSGHAKVTTYQPRQSPSWKEAAKRYQEIEQRYLKG